jgi:hypothetical protein
MLEAALAFRTAVMVVAATAKTHRKFPAISNWFSNFLMRRT